MNTLKHLWHNIANFAPWKAILITTLIQLVVSYIVCIAILVITGWVVPVFISFLFNMGVWYLLFPKVYKRVYPHGWQGGYCQ